jgi:hypothetical protein
MAVSATRWACSPNASSRVCWALARVSAARFALRLRLAAFRWRVAAAFLAEALRWVCVWVAIETTSQLIARYL